MRLAAWGTCCGGGPAAVGGVAHFTCNFSILGGLAAGGVAAPFQVGALAFHGWQYIDDHSACDYCHPPVYQV